MSDNTGTNPAVNRLSAERPKGAGERALSHGRGGAGNIGKPRRGSEVTPDDLVTPTLKGANYTTGRGGTGNMAKNDPNNPEEARRAQDVEAPVHREPEGNFRFGRGGAANVTKPADEEKKLAQIKNQAQTNELKRETSREAGDTRGLAEKGKDLLGKLTGKK